MLQRHIQRLHELVDPDGLGEIAEESRLQTRLDVARYRVGAQGEDRDVSRCRVSAQDLHGVGAADAGQIDIHQYHLRPGGARELDAQLSVHGGQQPDIGPARDKLLDQPQVGRVVLYIEQGAKRRTALDLRLGGCCGFVRIIHERWCTGRIELNPEHAYYPDLAFHADDTPHQLDQPLGDDQADSSAFLGAGLLPETIERLEKLRQLLRSQSCARVPDADPDALRGARGAFHHHGSACLVIFDRVGKKVYENLLYPGRVGIDEARIFEAGKAHADPALLRLRLDHRLALEHDPVQRHRFPGNRKLAGLDEREIENFVDQLQQIPPCLENLVDARLLRRCRQRGTGFQELAEAEDCVERGAKLVAHAGKEIRFGEVRLFRDGLGVGQLCFDLPALGQVPGQLGETARIAGLVPY